MVQFIGIYILETHITYVTHVTYVTHITDIQLYDLAEQKIIS